jgi:hypothetical protein
MWHPSEADVFGEMSYGKDYYLPIEQEWMGRAWHPTEVESSLLSTPELADHDTDYDKSLPKRPSARSSYKYHDILDDNDSMRKDDYYLDNTDTVREYLFSNVPSFHATEPLRIRPRRLAVLSTTPEIPMSVTTILIIFVFIIMVIIAMVQNSKINQLQTTLLMMGAVGIKK